MSHENESKPSIVPRTNILLVDDDMHVLTLLKDLFEDKYNILLASSGPESIQFIQNNDNVATVVMDIKMPGMNGISAAREIKK